MGDEAEFGSEALGLAGASENYRTQIHLTSSIRAFKIKPNFPTKTYL